jgi:hypothetical protein
LWKNPLQFFLILATHGRSIDRSIDGFPVPLIPTFLSHRPKRKGKEKRSFRGWLASSQTLGSRNLVIGKPSGPKESLIRNLGNMNSSQKKNSSSRQISEQFSLLLGRIFFVFFFLVAAVAGGIPGRGKRLGIF